MSAPLDAAYERCRVVARHHGVTFARATRLLPADRRPHVSALYALARTADDLVDEPAAGSDPAAELASLERRFRDALHAAAAGSSLDEVAATDPVVAAAADTARRHQIPIDCFDRFFASMRQDLTITSYETWDDLLVYVEGSAAAIGEMLLPLLEPPDREAAVAPARALGVAFQLTNFLRDVGEDLDRGRSYLPQSDLRRFGVDLSSRRATPEFVSLMRFEIDRCRGWYVQADAGIAVLPFRARLAIGAARAMYAAILDEIERRGHDVFDERIRVPRRRQVVAWVRWQLRVCRHRAVATSS